MTVKQQEKALKEFVNWLKDSHELGREPVEIEIEEIFEFEGCEYAIFKFKKDKGDNWLVGVGGGFKNSSLDTPGHNWSEFEEFDANKAQTQCEQYVSKIKNTFKALANQDIELDKGINVDPIKICNDLIKAEKWEDVIKFVDENIEHYIMPRENDGYKFYQFASWWDFIYYVFTHPTEKIRSVSNIEYVLLRKKITALFQLKEYKKELEVLDQILLLNPNDVSVYFTKIEIASKQNDIVRLDVLLDELYPYLWNYKDFACFLRWKSYIYQKKQDWTTAVNYLAWSLEYDNSNNAYKQVNDDLYFIKRTTNSDYIEKPSYQELKRYFTEKKLLFLPLKKNYDYLYRLYEFVLIPENKIPDNFKQLSKTFLDKMTLSSLSSKMIEVKVFTPNFMYVNNEYRFNFQISKDYKLLSKTEASSKEVLYEFENDKQQHIKIQLSTKFDSEENQKVAVDKDIKTIIDAGFEILSQDSFVGTNRRKSDKIFVKKDNTLQVVFFFEMSPGLLCRISAKVSEDHSDVEGEIIKIINSWQN